MREETLPDVEAVAKRAARVIAEAALAAVAARGRFLLATSGGTTPWRMLRLLADEHMPWPQVHLFQVDERVVPESHPERNLAQLNESLLSHVPVPLGGVYAIPVEQPDLSLAAATYALTLRTAAGAPPVLDLVHLGLGEDGHTASLFPNDAALEITKGEVAVTSAYRGHRRLTLTYPVLNRARDIVWIVTGAAKGAALARLRQGDQRIPAGRVQRDSALILSDASADAGALTSSRKTSFCH